MTGKVDSLAALKTPKTLLVSLYRAGVPAGSIRHLQLPRQEGHTFFFSFRDIPGKKTLRFFESELPLLAETDVHYEGEPVLIIAAKNIETLTRAKKQTRVEYETNYTIKTFEHPDAGDIVRMKHYRRGDSSKALKDAAEVFQEEYFFPGYPPRICGSIGAWASYTDGIMEVQVTSGWIHHARRTVAEVLDLDLKHVRVQGISSGFTDDALSWYPSALAAYTALAAFQTGRPALLELDDAEKNTLYPRSIPVRTVFRTGIGKDGRIDGREIDIDMDAGAYPAAPNVILDRACVSSLGIYGCPNFTVTGRIVRTNNPPADISHGAGITPALAAAETHAGRIAPAVGKDPLCFRREALQLPYEHSAGIRQKKNLLKAGKLLDMAAGSSDFARKFGAFELNRKNTPAGGSDNLRRGIGLAVTFSDGCLPGLVENDLSGAIRLQLDTESSLSIQISTMPGHQSSWEIWKRTAGSILGVPPERVHISASDTAAVPDAGPAVLSRNITVIRTLIEKAAGAIQRRRFRAPLPIAIKRSFKLPKSVTWDTNTLKGSLFHRLTWAVWVVEVSYDPVLLRTTIQNIWGVLDCGRVLDARAARGALEEEIYTALGHLTGTSILPPAHQTVPISIEFRETSSREEVRGLTNAARSGVIAAFLSAAEQASDQALHTLPVTDRALFRHRSRT